ncbi:hypothetical protein AB0I60_23210 [Actinosynnema sp. NPDC050436]|uniref:hypothetical protein n=1 Tax=Actinosynnema sp. NPDC050436 TaxID=3155659 RepID=UPI0033E1BA44
MAGSVQGVVAHQWAMVDGSSPIKSELHADAVQFTFGDGSVELLFTPEALARLLSEGAEALRLMNAGG